MAHSVTFHLVSSSMVPFSEQNPDITSSGFSSSNINAISVSGDPWVFFDSPNYTGDFAILGQGNHKFPKVLKKGTIQSLRLIKGGISSSEVVLYHHPFYPDPAVSFSRKQTSLPGPYFSLKVTKGAVVFYDEEQFLGEKRILLNGDEVQNFSAVKLPCIGKSMKPAEETKEE